jgi:hypothetical protein
MQYPDMITLALLSQDDSGDENAGFETNFSSDETIDSEATADTAPTDEPADPEADPNGTIEDPDAEDDGPDLADNPMNDETIPPEDRPRPEVGELSVDKVAEKSEDLRQKDEIKQSKEAP